MVHHICQLTKQEINVVMYMSRRRIVKKRGIDELNDLKVTCNCGHVIIMPVFKDSVICSHCGKKVLNNTNLYFKYKLRKEMMERK